MVQRSKLLQSVTKENCMILEIKQNLLSFVVVQMLIWFLLGSTDKCMMPAA